MPVEYILSNMCPSCISYQLHFLQHKGKAFHSGEDIFVYIVLMIIFLWATNCDKICDVILYLNLAKNKLKQQLSLYTNCSRELCQCYVLDTFLVDLEPRRCNIDVGVNVHNLNWFEINVVFAFLEILISLLITDYSQSTLVSSVLLCDWIRLFLWVTGTRHSKCCRT